MEHKSIAMIKKLFETEKVDESFVNDLKKDERKGVQKLIKQYERQKLREQKIKQNFVQMSRYEKNCYANGCQYIAGVDEAGRGPLAGPVVAASVILPREFELLGLNDSKQLNESTINKFFSILKNQAVSYGISIISSQKIDQVNIYEATKLAMYDAINQLNPKPDHVLLDAVSLENLPCTSEPIIKGDQESITIAAASILAKVTRDNLMKDLHKNYPVYEFKSNMGYGTKHHMEMLTEHGISPYHRKSYAPVRNAIN
ncbi:ribonuclease HII [Virgibacillus salinus]|uniref:Ribonuclease HII n=1 Tax=Virgibacillus salinus TaxID=553311 RepID=A0A1H1CBU0_9BACI|nr:ribonuclease HII [Virgibacillus salinus]SDQ61106.1 RNase HII [Virgibacillus salinus]